MTPHPRWLMALTVVLAIVSAPTSVGVSRASGAAAWERVLDVGTAWWIYTPTSGALLVQLEDQLLRSDDAGLSWYTVPLPPRGPKPSPLVTEVDPSNHAHMFAGGDGGLFESRDDGKTWKLSLPMPLPLLGVVISPLQPELVFASFARGGTGFQTWRSLTGGDDWELIEGPFSRVGCNWELTLLQPDPGQARRVWRSATCVNGLEIANGLALQRSTDHGRRYVPLMSRPSYIPRTLVGGRSALPARWYLLGNRATFGPGESALFRSDDDGNDWDVIYDLAEGTAPSAIALDPIDPNTLALGVGGSARSRESDVVLTRDGGSTWEYLGTGTLGAVRALALGIDGASMFAASARGVWRLPLRDAVAPEAGQPERARDEPNSGLARWDRSFAPD